MGAALPGAIDYPRLSAHMRILGVANRLELLRALQVPKTVAEIQLHPFRQDPGRNPARGLSRQAVEMHLQKVQALGLVQARKAVREGRSVLEYSLNLPRLFVFADEVRRLSLLGTSPAGLVETRPQADAPEPAVPPPPQGPAFVLVRGPLEGTAFALRGAGPWTVGRERGLAVALTHDPFVSKENARVWRDGRAFLVQNVPASRNGTRLNWRLLADGEAAELAPGDAVGVGRSLLLFRGA